MTDDEVLCDMTWLPEDLRAAAKFAADRLRDGEDIVALLHAKHPVLGLLGVRVLHRAAFELDQHRRQTDPQAYWSSKQLVEVAPEPTGARDDVIQQIGAFDFSNWGLDLDLHDVVAKLLSEVVHSLFKDHCEVALNPLGLTFEFWEEGVTFLVPWSCVGLFTGDKNNPYPTLEETKQIIAAGRARLDQLERNLGNPMWVEEHIADVCSMSDRKGE